MTEKRILSGLKRTRAARRPATFDAYRQFGRAALREELAPQSVKHGRKLHRPIAQGAALPRAASGRVGSLLHLCH